MKKSGLRQAGRHHPEEQGLKPNSEIPTFFVDKKAGRHHPEEQGLKQYQREDDPFQSIAGRHHPEEQGLKHSFFVSHSFLPSSR